VTGYRTPHFPPGDFTIIDNEGNEDGVFNASMFSRDPRDNSYACQAGGRPLFLRVVRQRNFTITTIDGAGQRWEYTMVPVGST